MLCLCFLSCSSLLITHAAFCSLQQGGGVTGAVTAVFLNYLFFKIVFLLLGHDVRTVSVLSWTTSSSRLAKIPFLPAHPWTGPALQYLRTRPRTHGSGRRAFLLAVTGGNQFLGLCVSVSLCQARTHNIPPVPTIISPDFNDTDQSPVNRSQYSSHAFIISSC